MDNKEITEKILNKKFKKSVFSGYDCADVDSYFDTIIEYLKNNDKIVKEYAENIISLKQQISKLQSDKNNLLKEKEKLLDKIKEYEEEGYGNFILKRHQQK